MFMTASFTKVQKWKQCKHPLVNVDNSNVVQLYDRILHSL
jgi:hypothetical protein